MTAVTTMPHTRFLFHADDRAFSNALCEGRPLLCPSTTPVSLIREADDPMDITADFCTPSVHTQPSKPHGPAAVNDAQSDRTTDNGDGTTLASLLSPKPFKVPSGTNAVYCIAGPRDIFLKHTDSTEIAAWAGLLGRRCKRLVSVVALHDPENKVSVHTKSKAMLRALTERQREAVRKVMKGKLCCVVTAGPRHGWRRRSLQEFTKEVRDPMVQQRVLQGCFLAIDEIHTQGVQHNDLHAGNFFVDTWNGKGVRPRCDLEVRLYDFDRSTRVVQSDDGLVYHKTNVPELTPVWCPNSDTWHFLHTVLRLAYFSKPVRALLAAAIGKPEYVKSRGPVLGVEDPAGLQGAWCFIDGSARVQGSLGCRPSKLHVVFEFAQAPATGFGHNPCFFEPAAPYDHLGLPVLQGCIAREGDRVGSIRAFQHLPTALALRGVLQRNVAEVIAVLRLCLFRCRVPLDLHCIVVWFMNAFAVDS